MFADAWAWPFVALIALSAGLAFVSTYQFRLPLRLGLWVAAVISLGMAIRSVSDWHGDDGFLFLLTDARKSGGDWTESVLFKLAMANAGLVAGYFEQFALVMLALLCAVCLLALVAFLPGETLDRMLRYKTAGLVGMLLGGGVTLSLVALGLGGLPDRQAYLFNVPPWAELEKQYKDCFEKSLIGRAVDGDTLKYDGVRFRFANVDAPEFDCTKTEKVSVATQYGRKSDGTKVFVGEHSFKETLSLVEGKTVYCLRTGGTSYSRPIVECEAIGAKKTDIAEKLTELGLVVPMDEAAREEFCRQPADPDVEGDIRGLCMLFPTVWRNRTDKGRYQQLHTAFTQDDWKWSPDGVVCRSKCPSERRKE